MSYTIDDVVKFAATKDNLRLQTAIGDVMSQKASDALETRKELVGRSFSDSPENNEEADEE
jgi:hypothetical protein